MLSGCRQTLIKPKTAEAAGPGHQHHLDGIHHHRIHGHITEQNTVLSKQHVSCHQASVLQKGVLLGSSLKRVLHGFSLKASSVTCYWWPNVLSLTKLQDDNKKHIMC